MSPKKSKDSKNILIYITTFVVGALLASNIFLFWQVARLTGTVEAVRSDIVQVVQAYNNLVTTLQQQGVIQPGGPPQVDR